MVYHPTFKRMKILDPKSVVRFVFVLGLFLCAITCSGCLSSPAEQNAVQVTILKKSIGAADMGECTYETDMAVTNNGTTDIHNLFIRVELYDPGAQKLAAQESVSIGDLHAGEETNATSRLVTHCRLNYTLRAYAQY